MFRVLCEALEAMIQEHAIGIVSKNDGGQRCMKIGSMNLMVGSAKSLDIVSSVRPDLYHLACLVMAYQIRLGGAGFFRHAFANAEIVKRMHCIGRNNYTCADLSKLPTLLEHRDTITEMLESKRSAQTTDAAPDYRYTRDLHGDHLNAGARALNGNRPDCPAKDASGELIALPTDVIWVRKAFLDPPVPSVP